MSYFTFESKRIYYHEIGQGRPIVFLHGNAVSSKMFKIILPLYQKDYKVILIDFLGYGKSEHLHSFPTNLFDWQAQQVVALLKHLNYQNVSLIGTSGGAWVAMNAALKNPELINKVVADSFDGNAFAEDFNDNLIAERKQASRSFIARGYYKWCLGKDWKNTVALDTIALLEYSQKKISLFCQSLETLDNDLLLIGSRVDDMCRKDMEDEYLKISKEVRCAKVHMFDTGKHPSLVTNAKASALVIKDFLNS